MQKYDNLLTIIIPIYNEEKSLSVFLPEVLKFCDDNGCKVIVINDGSVDKTPEILKQFSSDASLQIINHKVNKGYGGAIKSGIAETVTKYLITIDADGQHQLSDVKNMLDNIISSDADMIVGSRKGQSVSGLYRSLGKFFIRLIAKILMPLHIYDINSGIKIYNTELAKKYIRLCPDTMAYSDIVTLIFISQKHLVMEQPITVSKRLAGKSTINAMTAIDTIREIINIVVLFNPMRIFFPIAVLSVLAGFAWGIPLMIQGRGVSGGAILAIITGLIFFFLGLIAEQLSHLRKSYMKN